MTGLASLAATQTVVNDVRGQSRTDHTTNVKTGAARLAADGVAPFAGKRVGLIANHTARVGDAHLADLMAAAAPRVMLSAILAPEHGFRGAVEAGEKVKSERDPKTGVPVHSLYGASRKPSPDMLRGLDVLVFDIQDIGARFYTYISTMGLAMQAAAQARIPFVVLDRPNPLGGDYVSGFVLEPPFRSFVGQYEIPIVHGMTVGELARMIKGERLLPGLEALELDVIKLEGWRRAMRWPATGLPWVATSPNIPSFASALVYPGIGMVGELNVSEGRGTPTPFELFGAPWLDAAGTVRRLAALKFPGVVFDVARITPKSIPGVAAKPRFAGQTFNGVAIGVTDIDAVRPMELGMHALALIAAEARTKRIRPIYGNDRMFNQIAGTSRLRAMLDRGAGGAEIVASWAREVEAFKRRRGAHLLYS